MISLVMLAWRTRFMYKVSLSIISAALEVAAEGFRSAVERRGPDTFGMFSCSKATNEVNYAAQKLSRLAFRSNNVDSRNRT